MEDILMGGGSDSDDSDDSKAPAPSASSSRTPAAPAATTAPPPNSSKSELTNRLKNLYASSPSNVAAQSNAGGSSSVAPSALPRGGIQVPSLPNRPPSQPAPGPGYGHNNMPPPAPHPQQPPPGYHPSNRMPAPLPNARSTKRSAPPSDRMASVPPSQGQYPPGYRHPLPSSSSQYPPQQQLHQQPRPSSRQSMPPQHMPQTSKTQQRPSLSQQQQQQARSSSQQPPQQQARSSSSRGSSADVSNNKDKDNLSESEKKEKEKFLMFTRVLMKYLEQRDKVMHQKAKAQIKECYEKNKQGDPMFKSLTTSMKARLRSTVGEVYWRKAHDYLEHFFRQKSALKDEKSPGQSSSSRSSQQQQQQSSSAPSSGMIASQPSSSRQLTQSQQAAAMKMPLPSGGRSAGGSTAAASSGSVSTASSNPAMSAVEVAAAAKKKAEDEKREKQNERNRLRRAQAKKKREAEAAAKKAAEAVGVSGVTYPPINPSAATMLPNLGTTATPSSVSTTTSGASKKDKDVKKKTLKHQTSVSSTSSTKKKTPASKEQIVELEQLDHAVMIDLKSLPNLLSKEFMSDVNLNEEQRKLLYGDKQVVNVKKITDAAAKYLSSDVLGAKLKEKGVTPLQYELPNIYAGWGVKNVVSTRTAWAKVRLPERENIRIEREREAAEKARKEKPMGEPPLSDKTEVDPPSMGSIATEQTASSAGSLAQMPKIEDDTTNHVWHCEARASQDPALALLSEATELFLKDAIEKIIRNARHRQNLDGVRLWNSLQARADPKNACVASPPPAIIRLGCDVSRQVALAEGNAAKIYQRMEEAISRQNDDHNQGSADLDTDAMILESTSMADFSRKPPLKSAAKKADACAKRKFEVYGGKHAKEPPLGRVPKQARVSLQDMAVGRMGNRAATNRAWKMAMMASLFS